MWLAILRHGAARYRNIKLSESEQTKFFAKNWGIEAFITLAKGSPDLKSENIEDLRNNIQEYLAKNEDLLKDKEIKIWTSPFGRTMETSAYLIEWIQNNELLKDNIKSISLVDQLQEVKNFERSILSVFVNGWDLEIDGKVVSIDKGITNPDNLSTIDYFFQWVYAKVDDKYLTKLWILDRINSIETYEEITSRSQKDLWRILGAVGEDQFVFVVSHQAMTDWLFVKKEWYENGWQEAGKFLNIVPSDFE